MLLGGAIMIGMAAAGAAAVLLPQAEIALAGREIRVGDVARLARLAPDARRAAAGRIVARLPDGRSSVTLSRAAVAGLVRRALPGIELEPGAADEAMTLRAPAGPDGSDAAVAGCLALARPVMRGEALTEADASAAACDPSAPRAAIAYDRRAGTVRAAADLDAGVALGRIRLPAAGTVAPGETMTLTSTAGPVRIRRDVVAVQSGRPGGRLFVRTGDGEVLAATLPAAAGEEAER